MRAVNVEALSPCSAVQIQYVSIAFTCAGSASPRQRSRNFSAAVVPAATSSSGTDSLVPVGDTRRARDDGHHLRGQPPEVLARLLVGVASTSLVRPQTPDSRAISACASAGAFP